MYPVLGKKLNWRKTGIEERGGFSRGGEATEQDFSDSNREGGPRGEGKTFHYR